MPIRLVHHLEDNLVIVAACSELAGQLLPQPDTHKPGALLKSRQIHQQGEVIRRPLIDIDGTEHLDLLDAIVSSEFAGGLQTESLQVGGCFLVRAANLGVARRHVMQRFVQAPRNTGP